MSLSLREKINRNPMVMGLAGVVLVAVAVWVVYRTVTDEGLRIDQPTQYYFTTDDGKTLFGAPMTSIPPFEKDGKVAVLAHVFTCDKGKTQFVGYLAKYSDSFAKQAAAQIASAQQSGKPMTDGGPLTSSSAAMNMFVKKPGGAEWFPMISPQASEISSMWCPSRDPWDLVEQYPKD